MRKIIPRVSLALLAGVIVNICVTWSIALWVDVEGKCFQWQANYMQDDAENWHIYRAEVGSALLARSTRSTELISDYVPPFSFVPEAILPPWGNLNEPTVAFASRTIEKEERHVDARGWPFLSMWSGLDYFYANGVQTRSIRFGIPSWKEPFSDFSGNPFVLPLMPIWLGFSSNSALYALALLFLYSLSRFVIRAKRFMSGCCPECQYNLHGDYSKPCSECGWCLRATGH